MSEDTIRAFQEKYNLLGKKVLFFSGRVSRAKGIDVCLKLIKEFSKTIPEITLLIAGQDNAYVQEILSKEEFAGLQDKVIFTGWLSRKDVMCAYCSSTLIPVLSLYVDPFPTTNLEAMLAKKPVLGTCFGGTPEIVENGETGFIVDPYDFPEVLAKAKALLEDSILREKFGIAGYERLLKEFQLKSCVDNLEKIYGKSK
jgi:glycosyltransferase involved in cell wall biosynthesis